MKTDKEYSGAMKDLGIQYQGVDQDIQFQPPSEKKVQTGRHAHERPNPKAWEHPLPRAQTGS